MKKLLLVALIFCACSAPEKVEDSFFSYAKDSHIDFQNQLTFNGDFNILEYLYYYNGGGVSIGDINNDDLPDVFFTGNEVSNRLYLNKGNLQFEDITDQAGLLTENTWSTGSTLIDINNDGWLDIYVCNLGKFKIYNGKNQLFINQKDGSFKEQATEYGLDFSGFSTQSAFLDFDQDGDLDMYLLNHSYHSFNSFVNADQRAKVDSLTGDRLFENLANEGKKLFKDVTAESGIYSSHLGYGLGVGISDVNNDHWPDIYVSNDFHENDYLYINDQNGHFKEVASEQFGHHTKFSMGNDLVDINNDGEIDIFTLDMMPSDHEILLRSAGEDKNKLSIVKKNSGYHSQYARNSFQMNKGNGSFVDIAPMTNSFATDWSWAPLIADFNNDGQQDIYIANGIYKRPNDLDFINFKSSVDYRNYNKDKQDSTKAKIIEGMPSGKIQNVFFWGDTLENFTKTLAEKSTYTNGTAYADLDNDGDLDLVNNNINQPAELLENQSSGDYLRIKVKGTALNPFGIGTKVILHAGNTKQVKELYTVRGFLSSSESFLHFGLRNQNSIDRIEIYYLGKVKELTNVPVNQVLEISLEDQFEVVNKKEKVASVEEAFILPFKHEEDNFYDYEVETLIPFSLSRKGPAIAFGDINGDNIPELYTGGAHYQTSQLFKVDIAGGNLEFESVQQNVFAKEDVYEDVDGLFVDVDGDADQDLVVVSGGGRFKASNEASKHRLYRNDNGNLIRDQDFDLFQSNGSCVRSADYDGDGDQDLFIGSLSMQGLYGVSPNSMLLQNDGTGKFTKVKVDGLNGMVTDAAWVDHDGDGDQDLIIVGLWMKPTLFINEKGRLVRDNSFFPEDLHGWWNSIEIADINNDEKPDFILGNFGLNSMVDVSEEYPMSLYIQDFDQNGRLDPVIFRYFNGHEIPLFSKEELTDQLPVLRKKFPQYEKYSKIKSIQDLLDVNMQPSKIVNTLTSMVILNNESGLKQIPLPIEAQLSTINDIQVSDVNKDGFKDLLFVGNYETLIASFGDLDANSGSILYGDGTGVFKMGEDLPLKAFRPYNKISPIAFGTTNYWLVGENNGEVKLINLD